MSTYIQPAAPDSQMPNRILLVEDDEGLVELFREELAALGPVIEWAASGQHALNWAQAHPDGLLILDYSLPDMTAQNLIETLNQSGNAPPFIVITGHGDERVAVNMMKLGARDYLIKDIFLPERLPLVTKRVLREIANERNRLRMEAEQQLSIDTLEILNRADDLPNMLTELVHLIKNQTNCEAIGFRLKQGTEYPFLVQEGFTADAATPLHLPPQPDPQNPAFTPAGSFWTNSFQKSLSHPGASDSELAIIGADYESVALIKLCSKQSILGFLQINDHRSDRFTLPQIQSFEQLAKVIVIAINRIQTETELQHSQRSLLQSQKMELVGQLAGGVSHDFNNILQAIEGYSQLLLDCTPESDERRHDIEEIHRSGQRAAALTRQLLAFSRRQMLMPRATDLNDLITNLLKMMVRLLGENIECTTELAPQLWPAKVDPGQLEQVLVNLAVNARDAMESGGKLVIHTSNIELTGDLLPLHPDGRPGRFIRLSITDTGSGMSDDVKAHLFEPYFTTKARGKGTGLGLATVYGIIKQHEGWIAIHSELGTGTTFNIFIPAADTPVATKPTTGPQPNPTPKGTGELILIVEDEERVRNLTHEILILNGYRVITAATCAEALSLFSKTVDLVFSDVLLPDGNGFDLIAQLEQRNPALKCVLCSGYADIHERWPEVEQRDIRFLIKPFNQADLLKTLAEKLKTRSTNDKTNLSTPPEPQYLAQHAVY